MTRIQWVESPYGPTAVTLPVGKVDGVRLFTISWGFSRALPYTINTDLPGIKVNSAATTDEARARCERVLEKWLQRMLATAVSPA